MCHVLQEGKDKQFLLSRITDIQGKGTTASQLRSNQKALSRKPNNNTPSSLLSAAEVGYSVTQMTGYKMKFGEF